MSASFSTFLERLALGPWQDDPHGYAWIAAMGVLVGVSCGLTGLQLILRRMAMMGDAISHSVLPGLVLAYLASGSLGPWLMLAGAVGAGLATTGFVQLLRQASPLKQDAAIGISFSTLFAVGVVLVALFADRIHLDTDAVLFGEILFVPLAEPAGPGALAHLPLPVARMALLCTLTIAGLSLFRKPLLVSAFDDGLSRTVGYRPSLVHYGLMAWTAVTVVGSFEAVGAISVVAMLVFPGATALLLSSRLPVILALICAQAVLSTVLGIHLAWAANASVSASIVLASCALFAVAWLASRRRA